MFAVFERTLLTDVGKSFVHDHEDDADAQEVYKAVVDYWLPQVYQGFIGFCWPTFLHHIHPPWFWFMERIYP